MKTISFLILAAFGQFAAIAADPLQDAEQAWVKAITKRDFALLDQILSSDLIYNHATGVVDTKASYIASQKKGDRRYDTVTYMQSKAKQYGDTGVVSSKVRITGINPSGKFDDTLLLIHVWVKQGGVWKMVAHQTTKLQ